MSSYSAPSQESKEERDARLEAEWAAMTPAQRRERVRQLDLKLLARWQAVIDEGVVNLGGVDHPAYRHGPNGEPVKVADSTLRVMLGLKHRFIEHAARVRRGEPLA
jgi:hypothetical protein